MIVSTTWTQQHSDITPYVRKTISNCGNQLGDASGGFVYWQVNMLINDFPVNRHVYLDKVLFYTTDTNTIEYIKITLPVYSNVPSMVNMQLYYAVPASILHAVGGITTLDSFMNQQSIYLGKSLTKSATIAGAVNISVPMNTNAMTYGVALFWTQILPKTI